MLINEWTVHVNMETRDSWREINPQATRRLGGKPFCFFRAVPGQHFYRKKKKKKTRKADETFVQACIRCLCCKGAIKRQKKKASLACISLIALCKATLVLATEIKLIFSPCGRYHLPAIYTQRNKNRRVCI